MFSSLPPNSWLDPHWGPSKQVLRYHLALKAAPHNLSTQWLSLWDCGLFGNVDQLGGFWTVADEIPVNAGTFRGVRKRPDVWSSSEAEKLFKRACPEDRLGWEEGSDILFDDTFIHTAVNI